MKPANFPERKRQRQIRALARIGNRKLSTDIQRRRVDEEMVALHAAIAAGPRRDVRTKKDRSARAKLTRTA